MIRVIRSSHEGRHHLLEDIRVEDEPLAHETELRDAGELRVARDRGGDDLRRAQFQDLLGQLLEILLRHELRDINRIAEQAWYDLPIVVGSVVIRESHEERGRLVDVLPDLADGFVAGLAVQDEVGQQDGLAGLRRGELLVHIAQGDGYQAVPHDGLEIALQLVAAGVVPAGDEL